MLNRHGTDMSILVEIELRVLVEISRLDYVCHFELNMERIRVLKILDRHGLKLLSKNARKSTENQVVYLLFRLNGFPQRSILIPAALAELVPRIALLDRQKGVPYG